MESSLLFVVVSHYTFINFSMLLLQRDKMTKLSLWFVRSQSRLWPKAPLFVRCCSANNNTLLRWSTTTAYDESSSYSLLSSSISIKERILESALKQVPFYGWTQDAIVAGIQQDFANNSNTTTGTGSTTASLSMAGLCTPRDLVRFHMDRCNTRLRQELPVHLKSNVNDDATRSVGTCSLEDKIASAFQLRLGYSKQFIEQSRWHEGMALGVSSSDQAWTTTEQIKEIVNIAVDACSAVMPEQSSDSNMESQYHQPRIVSDLERLTLGGIYVATELHMLTDTSPGYQDSWDFLRQRMNEWEIVSNSSLLASVVAGATGGASSSFGVGDALSVGRTLTTAFASAAASVLQVNPPFITTSSK
jgi:rpsU-divergently transcribed protein